MKQSFFEIIENRPLTDSVMLMKLKGDTSAITGPGQFVNVKITDCTTWSLVGEVKNEK